MSLYEYVYVGAVHKSFQYNFTFTVKGHTSGLAQFQPYYKLHSRDFYVFANFDLLSQAPGCDVELIYTLPPFCGTLANKKNLDQHDPDQTPHNQGGVGSGSPLLFARNLNKKAPPKTTSIKWL